ncbi:hypothetical protein CEXT_6591 [Caerostris extrusa]|uniref:ditrans,polycis-polyprenyl diphosphate synthase [(2E,6E)-farnesyldiphosphate specific] n=1 Tax=Caerostris extrusa TaxID=172846 RepID=A0AAV4MCR0_CAEEX|nr:hypothetical protein CEXT_6591 [Caerostris extrusa]
MRSQPINTIYYFNQVMIGHGEHDVELLLCSIYGVAGIHHVSIYDSTGFIKSNGNQLYREANLRKNSYLQKKASSLNIIFSDGKVPYLYNTITKNGHKTEDVNVYLLSREDGKQQIVKAAKLLCKDARMNPDILENFYAQNFESYIKGALDVPDPELLMVFGKTNALIGYLPWHIRLSENIVSI